MPADAGGPVSAQPARNDATPIRTGAYPPAGRRSEGSVLSATTWAAFGLGAVMALLVASRLWTPRPAPVPSLSPPPGPSAPLRREEAQRAIEREDWMGALLAAEEARRSGLTDEPLRTWRVRAEFELSNKVRYDAMLSLLLRGELAAARSLSTLIARDSIYQQRAQRQIAAAEFAAPAGPVPPAALASAPPDPQRATDRKPVTSAPAAGRPERQQALDLKPMPAAPRGKRAQRPGAGPPERSDSTEELVRRVRLLELRSPFQQ